MVVSYTIIALLTTLVRLASGYTYLPTIGLGTGPTYNGLLFAAAARSPVKSNNVSFVGFNFAGSPALAATNVNSTQRWILQANYTGVHVNDSTPAENNTIPYVTLDLILPQPNPLQDNTNWTLCRSLYSTTFPADVIGNTPNENGDCTATLGADCLRDWLSLYESRARSGPFSSNCPRPPFWNDVPSCYARFGYQYSMSYSSIMNWTDPHYYFSSGSWYNQTSNGTAVMLPANFTPPYSGLQSYQPFTYVLGQGFPSNENQSAYNQYAGQMRMVAFALTPSADFTNNASANYQFQAQGNLTRVVCLRIDPTVSSAASSFGRGMFEGRLGWMSIGFTTLMSLLLF